jgi:hypothetical protein
MIKQLRFNFNKLIESSINERFYIGKRDCWISRENYKTTIYIGGLNFLDKPMGCLFRASNLKTLDSEFQIDELNDLNYNELISFMNYVVRTYELKVSEWDSNRRINLFKFIIKGYKLGN